MNQVLERLSGLVWGSRVEVPAFSDDEVDAWVLVEPFGTALDRLEGARRSLTRHPTTEHVDRTALENGARLVRVRPPQVDDKLTAARYAGQMAGRALRDVPCRRIALLHDAGDDEKLACLEGVVAESDAGGALGDLRDVRPWGRALPTARTCLARGAAFATGVTRKLVECPPNDLTPQRFARLATTWAVAAGLYAQVIEAGELAAAGFAATELIGRSSAHPPCAVVVSNTPTGPVDIAIIGKGITFDSGGISLKPATNMGKLKGDMAGAAAALTGALAAVQAGPVVPFALVLPLAENLPDGSAVRPGDVVEFSDGTRVHVETTDAEGRMVLADGALFARKRFAPRAILTIGTLTKACITALGNFYAALYARDDRLAASLSAAGQAAGERLWRMPLAAEYAYSLRSPVADLANASDDGGGSIQAATFIGRFMADVPWAHVDMSSIFFMDRPLPWADKGYTGAGARLVAHFLAGTRRHEGAEERGA